MIKVELRVGSESARNAIRALADTTVDLTWRGFKKHGRMIVSKVNCNFVFYQEFRRGDGYAELHEDVGQRVRDDEESQEVPNPL